MTKALKEAKLEAHLDAIEKHKALQELTLTLEEYLKIIGIP